MEGFLPSLFMGLFIFIGILWIAQFVVTGVLYVKHLIKKY